MHVIKILYPVAQSLSLAHSCQIYGPRHKIITLINIITTDFLNYIITINVISNWQIAITYQTWSIKGTAGIKNEAR